MENYYIQEEEFDRQEDLIKAFLFKECDTVRFTQKQDISLGCFSCSCSGCFFWPLFLMLWPFGNKRKAELAKQLKTFKPDLIRIEKNSSAYNDIPQSKYPGNTHYFYKLSDKMIKRITKSGLTANFSELDDMTFYKKDKLVAAVIAHEKMVVFCMTEKDKQKANRAGLIFE